MSEVITGLPRPYHHNMELKLVWGIVGIFSHLKSNCPALLLYNLIIILIAPKPVGKQI